jgi:hypothetical protein
MDSGLCRDGAENVNQVPWKPRVPHRFFM